MIRKNIAVVSLLALLASASLIAQTFRGGISGTVADRLRLSRGRRSRQAGESRYGPDARGRYHFRG